MINPKHFKLGIDYLPDWAMDAIAENKLILSRDREINSPFDHNHKTNAFICEDGTLGIIGDYSEMVNEVSRLRSEYDLAVYKLTEFRMDHPDVEVR